MKISPNLSLVAILTIAIVITVGIYLNKDHKNEEQDQSLGNLSLLENISESDYNNGKAYLVQGEFYIEDKKIPELNTDNTRYIGSLTNWYGKNVFVKNYKGLIISPGDDPKSGNFEIFEFPINDSLTFELFGPGNFYARDSQTVYISQAVQDNNSADFNFTEISEADPATFKPIATKDLDEQACKGIDNCFTSYYAIDKNNAFYLNKLINNENLDKDSLVVLPDGPYINYYSKDGEDIYFKGELIKGVDAKTFKPLLFQPYEGCGKDVYAVDSFTVYYGAQKISDADIATFENLLSPYAKDRFGYFKEGKRMQNVPKAEELVCSYG